MNPRIGRVSQLLTPSYSWCLRCETTWAFVKWHDTMYGNGGHGCIPLCQKCWAELTPLERLPFYRQLIESWHEKWPQFRDMTFDQEWALVEKAVLGGG